MNLPQHQPQQLLLHPPPPRMTSGTTRMIATTCRVLTPHSLCWSGLEQAILGEPNESNSSSMNSFCLLKEFSDDPEGGGQCIHTAGSVPKVSFTEVTQVKSPPTGSTEEYRFQQELTQIPS